MRQLILLYWGCVFLMYLSQVYYPTSAQLDGPQTGRRHFMLRKADIFMIAVIVWMTCFSFLRTSYNDTWNYIFAWNNSNGARAFLESIRNQKQAAKQLKWRVPSVYQRIQAAEQNKVINPMLIRGLTNSSSSMYNKIFA